MASSDAAKQAAQTDLMPMLRGDDHLIDVRVGRGDHMAFIKLDPVAIANHIVFSADDDFRDQFFRILESMRTGTK